MVKNLTVDQVLGRVGGERVEHARVLDGTAPGFDVLLVAHLAQIGADAVMYQQYGSEGSRPEVLRKLSVGTKVVNAGWSITGNGMVSLAVDGVVAQVDKNNPGERSVLAADHDDLLDAKGIGRTAVMLAVVEHATGVRLTDDLVDGLSGEPWQTVMLTG